MNTLNTFKIGDYVAEIGANGASIKQIAKFSKDGLTFTLKGVNTKGEIESTWREYDAKTGISRRKEYKGAPLAQTFVVSLPEWFSQELASTWMPFEAAQVARVVTIADEVKNAEVLAARTAAAGLGIENFAIGEKKVIGFLGNHKAVCTVFLTVDGSAFTARVKYYDVDAEESFWSLGGREGKTFESTEAAIAVGRAIKSINLPAAWTVDKAAAAAAATAATKK